MEALSNTILIIEDDLGLNELISEKIKELGYQTHCLFSANDAINWLSEYVPLLMVVDYSLSDSTAKDFIDAIKTKQLALPPFLIATGQGDERIAVEMMKLGARDYIIKDTNLLELLPRVIASVSKEIESENKLKQAEQDLFESQQRFTLFMDHLPASVFLKESNGKTLYVNKYMDDVLGASKWIGKDMFEIFPNELGKKFMEDDRYAIEKGYYKTEENIQHLDNSIHTYETQKFIISQNGKEPLMGGIAMNITERKKMEEAIKFLITCGNTGSGEDFFESLAQYLSQVLEMEYVCIDKLDEDGLTAHTLAIYNDGIYDSNVSYTLKETPCGDVVGKTICFFPENVCNLFPNDAALRDLNAESYVGTTLWSFEGKPIGLIAIIGRKPLKKRILAENILSLVSVRAAGELERKKAEEALRESERILLKSQQIAQLGSYSWDIINGYWTSSAILDDIFGIDENYIRSTQGWIDLIHPDWKDIMNKYITHDIVLNHQRFDKEYKIVRKDNGQECWVHGLGDLEFDSTKQPIKLFGTISNINQRKMAELAILESEAKMKKVLIESSILIDSNSKDTDYQKITNTIAEISGAKYVSFDVVNNLENKIQTYALSGIKENILKISSLLGYEIVNKRWNQDPIKAEMIKNQIVTHFDSFNEITSSQIPLSISKLIEKTFNLGKVVIVKIAKANETIAFFTLFFSKDKSIQNADLVELFANQVSLYMERKKAEEALIKKNEDLDYMNKFMVNREVRMAEMKREVNELLESMGKEKRYL